MLNKLKGLIEARSLQDLREAAVSAFGEMGVPRLLCLSPVGHDRSVGRGLTNAGFPEEWETAYRDTRHMDAE